MAYLSGSSPHIKSGAVSALSILIYSDGDISVAMPDLVPSVLTLLQLKDTEIIKAVLGFIKVLVSTLETRDLLKFASDIVDGILPWSSMSRHHLRSKVTVILEILMRKCGTGSVKSWVPDKYRDFIRTVTENRHGKTGSKDSTPLDSEAKHPDRFVGRLKTSKQIDSRDASKGVGLQGSWKRKREDNQKGNTGGNIRPYGNRITTNKRIEHSGNRIKGTHYLQERREKGSYFGRSYAGKRKETTNRPSWTEKHNKFGNKHQKMNR
ncbi:hypothetical protein Leryth_001137 [Lithospermum erythrorhizon]|nr:hypothetical protein Leryth_001137 [Lithospermum erythrorhizon]